MSEPGTNQPNHIDLTANWRKQVLRKIRRDLYQHHTIPTHLFKEGYDPIDEESRRSLAADVLVDTWNEMVTIFNEEGYSAARTLETGLTERLEEAEAQTTRFDLDLHYYDLERELIEEDARTFGESATLREALENEESELEQRGWSWAPFRGDVYFPHDKESSSGQQVIQHRVPDEVAQNRLPTPYSEIVRSDVPSDGPSMFSPQLTFDKTAKLTNYLSGRSARLWHKTQRTCELIRFRLKVVQNAVYRFEVTGRVDPLTRKDVQELVEASKKRSPGRPREIDLDAFHDAVLNVVASSSEYWHNSGAPNKQAIYRELNTSTKREIRGALDKAPGDPISLVHASGLMKNLFEELSEEEMQRLRKKVGV